MIKIIRILDWQMGKPLRLCMARSKWTYIPEYDFYENTIRAIVKSIFLYQVFVRVMFLATMAGIRGLQLFGGYYRTCKVVHSLLS